VLKWGEVQWSVWVVVVVCVEGSVVVGGRGQTVCEKQCVSMAEVPGKMPVLSPLGPEVARMPSLLEGSPAHSLCVAVEV